MNAHGAKWIGRPTRCAIYVRDGERCVYCGRRVGLAVANTKPWRATLDHVRPRARGGDNRPANLVTACGHCNDRKGERDVEEFLAELPPRQVPAVRRRLVTAREAALDRASGRALAARLYGGAS